MSTAKKTGITIAMAALVLLGLTTGCGNRGGSGSGSTTWTWGCLTEADSSGEPAYAELATTETGQIVRVWDEGMFENVTVEVLGGELTDVATGAHDADADGMILADDLVLDLMRCEGESEDCSRIDAASIEIDMLEDGARRVSYRGTSVEGAIEGSFVVGR